MSNVLEVDLREMGEPGEIIGGINIGFDGWTGNRIKFDPKASGYTGIKIIGHGPRKTIISGEWDTIMIGQDVGTIEIVGATILCGYTTGIHCLNNNYLKLRQVEFQTKDCDPGKTTSTKWVVSSKNTDHEWHNVIVDAPLSAEHALYAHGFKKRGIYWNKVRILSIGGEGLKVATRPWEVDWVPNARILVTDCEFRNWYQPNSHRGGAGVTLQGCGAQEAHFERCVFVGTPAKPDGTPPRQKAFMVDDGLSTIQDIENNRNRFYALPDGDPGGMNGGGSANGHITLKNCAFQGYGGYGEMINTGTIFPNYEEELGMPYHHIAQSFKMIGCIAVGGSYKSMPTIIRLKEIKDDEVIIRKCNEDNLLDWADKVLGFDVTEEAILYTDFSSGPLSQFIS